MLEQLPSVFEPAHMGMVCVTNKQYFLNKIGLQRSGLEGFRISIRYHTSEFLSEIRRAVIPGERSPHSKAKSHFNRTSGAFKV